MIHVVLCPHRNILLSFALRYPMTSWTIRLSDATPYGTLASHIFFSFLLIRTHYMTCILIKPPCSTPPPPSVTYAKIKTPISCCYLLLIISRLFVYCTHYMVCILTTLHRKISTITATNNQTLLMTVRVSPPSGNFSNLTFMHMVTDLLYQRPLATVKSLREFAIFTSWWMFTTIKRMYTLTTFHSPPLLVTSHS